MTAAPEVESWGFWGEHGFAAVLIAAGDLSGRIGDVPFTGDFDLAAAYALGDVSGTQPGRHGERDLDGHRRGGVAGSGLRTARWAPRR